MWTPARIVEAAKAWPSVPTPEEWLKAGPHNPSAQTVREVFGTFRSMLDAAGLEPRRRKNDARGGWDVLSICNAIFRWHFEHGRLPRAHEWSTPPEGFPSSATVRRWFGGWNAAMVAAGYQPQWSHRSRRGYAAVVSNASRRNTTGPGGSSVQVSAAGARKEQGSQPC